MAAGVQGTGDAQHVRPMGLDPERERGEVGGALPTGRRVRSRGKFFSHQGSGPKAPYRYTATAAFSHLRDDAAAPWQGKNFHFTGANFSGGQVSPDDADFRGWPEPPTDRHEAAGRQQQSGWPRGLLSSPRAECSDVGRSPLSAVRLERRQSQLGPSRPAPGEWAHLSLEGCDGDR